MKFTRLQGFLRVVTLLSLNLWTCGSFVDGNRDGGGLAEGRRAEKATIQVGKQLAKGHKSV